MATGIGGKGNEGVSAYVKQIKGGVGYVELAYALQNKVAYAYQERRRQLHNPSDDSFAERCRQRQLGDLEGLLPGSSPTRRGPTPGRSPRPTSCWSTRNGKPGTKAAIEFFRWVYANGDGAAPCLGYVLLPDTLVQQIEAYWTKTIATP